MNRVALEQWRSRPRLTFVSAPIGTSSSSFAEIGHERNGSFFAD